MNFAQFQRPQRYIGNEWNVTTKNHRDKIKICISYPDLYEIGMSNLGLHILYSLFNTYPDVVCERAFMPAPDLAEHILNNRKKLFSLESKTCLDNFDILGFNFNYELNFTNFLHMLSLSGIPLWSKQRSDIIVIGGGVSNPEPLADFVDVFLLGEFEQVADKFIQVLRGTKSKQDRLKALSEIEGFYVPSFYRASFKNDKFILEKNYTYAHLPVKRAFVKDLNKCHYPLKWLTPHTEIIHDRIPIEIARGCPNQCTFCQARSVYYPYRERNISLIQKIAKKMHESSGYENLSFLALSASDYSHIEQLIDESLDYFNARRVGINLPSLRIDDILGRLYTRLARIKKTSLTVAVEAANEDLRARLNKRIDIKKLFEAAKIIRSLKLKHIKLYFMFGLPQETEDNLVDIGRFLTELNKQTLLNLNVSINPFIPKPFSLWEKVPMQEESILRKKRQIILKNIPRRRNIKVKISDIKKSILEAVISRADRRFSRIIYKAFTKGSRFDGHQDRFQWDIWEEAMKEENIDYDFYLKIHTENLPWNFINSAICRQ